MSTIEEHMIPDGFKDLLLDLSSDLYNAFPEFEDVFKNESCNVYYFYEQRASACPKRLLSEYQHCCDRYRPHFFDILYENETLFDSETPLYFLSGVDFRQLWTVKDISEQTRKTLWKYIQLILFKVIENTNDSSEFGNSETLFEAIDDDALKAKMAETLADIKKVFETMDESGVTGNDDSSANTPGHRFSDENMPNMENLHEHLSGLFKGKIGSLAEEIMSELGSDWEKDFGIKLDEADDDSKPNNINDIFSKLLKDPMKLINLIKKIGNKLEAKIKSGEVKESELLQETSEMMKNMKNTAGLKNMEKLFKTFAGTAGGNDKTAEGLSNIMSMMGGKNSAKKMNEFQNQLNINIRASKQRERMIQRLEERKKREAEAQAAVEGVSTNKTPAATAVSAPAPPKTNRHKKSKK